MKIGKTYIEFISEKKSKKKSPAAQIKKLTKKQKTLIDKSKDIKDEVSKLAADKDKNPEDKLTSLLLKNKINQTEIDGQKIAIQKQQIALNSKIKGVKKKKKSMPKNEQLAAYADEISLEEGLFGWLSGVFKNPGLKRKVRKLKDELVRTRIELGNLKLEGDPIEEFEAELKAKNDKYTTSRDNGRGGNKQNGINAHDLRIKTLENSEEAIISSMDALSQENEILQKYVDKIKLEARMESNNAIIRAADTHIARVIKKIQIKDKKAIKQMDGEIENLMKQDESYMSYLNESILNEEDSYSDYPEIAKKNAQKAIDWKEKYGRDEVDAGTAVGWARAHQLAKGENISSETVKRMSSFNRHRKNSSIATEYKDTPWKDKGYVSWLIWGGTEGVDWAMKKSKEIEPMKESTQMKYIIPFNKQSKSVITEGNYNMEDIYDLIAHHRFDKDFKKLSSKDKEWVENDAKERGFNESILEADMTNMYYSLIDELYEAKPGPKPYHRGLDDDEIEDKKDQIKKQSDMDDNDSSAYKEMPGDKEAREKGEVKTSKHVKKYHELYGDKKDESVVSEGKTISSSKISMMGAKILRKISIGTIFDTEDGEYEITDYGQQANAFKEFEAEHNGKQVKVKLTAMYGVKLEVTDDIRSARFSKEVRLNSIILESTKLNEFYFEKDEEERLQKFVDQLSFGDELEYRDGFSTGRGSFPNTRELKKELDSNFQLLLTQKSGRNWDLYVGSDDLVFLIQPDLGAKNYMQISISSTKEQWNDESSVFGSRTNGYSVYESVVNEASEDRMIKQIERALKDGTSIFKLPMATQKYYNKNKSDFESVITEAKTITKASIEEVGDSRNREGYSSNEYYILADFVDGEITMKDLAKLVKSREVQKELKGESEIDMEYLEEFSESVVNEEKIKYAKGKTYQSSGHWTVMVDSNSSMCDIRVNQSAGWRLDPHDDREETWELLDNGRQRATIYFKSGNIDKFAKQMFDLNDRTTWGNKTKLTAKDYADIIRVWIDMKMANEGNYNLEDIYDLIAHHRFDKDYKKLSSKDREWIENDAEERGFLESLSPRFFNSLLVTLNEDLIAESKVPNFKFGKKLQYKADDINQMYGFWGTLDVHMDTYEIEEIWNDVWGILTRGWKFSDAGALYYLNAKAGRWLADKVWNDINSQISQPDAIDMILSDYARPSKWKAWSKEFNEYAQEELAECVILEKAEGDRGPISDPKIEKALKTKSEETGVPIGIIRIIMRRGMAAWKTGHRPGATEQQWGYARVNAFLTKGKGTWGDADKDVAKEVRDEGHDKELKEQNHFDQSYRKHNI